MTLSTVHDPLSELRVEIPECVVGEHVNHRDCLLLWQVRGEAICLIEGARITLKAGHALWIPTGVRHGVTVTRNSVQFPMFFAPATYPTALTEPTLVPIDDGTATICSALVSSYYSRIAHAADLSRAVLRLVEACAATPEDLPMPRATPALAVARALILDPADRRTLADFSRELHISPRSLERAFVSETGMSWSRWRHACRMGRAARLLASGAETIATIADRVGFDTHSAFTRVFRERFGVTPSAYRLAVVTGSPAAM